MSSPQDTLIYWERMLNYNFDHIVVGVDDVTLQNVNGKLQLAPAWDVLSVSALSMKPSTLNVPSFSSFKTGTKTYMFSPFSTNDLFFSMQLPNNYKRGTDLKPYVYYTPKTNDTGGVVWEIEYTIAGIGDTFPSTTINSIITTESTIPFKAEKAAFTTISGSGLKESTMLFFRLSRLATSLDDTYPSDACLLSFNLHYQVEKIGTLAEFPTP